MMCGILTRVACGSDSGRRRWIGWRFRKFAWQNVVKDGDRVSREGSDQEHVLMWHGRRQRQRTGGGATASPEGRTREACCSVGWRRLAGLDDLPVDQMHVRHNDIQQLIGMHTLSGANR